MCLTQLSVGIFLSLFSVVIPKNHKPAAIRNKKKTPCAKKFFNVAMSFILFFYIK